MRRSAALCSAWAAGAATISDPSIYMFGGIKAPLGPRPVFPPQAAICT